ncbi:MAG: hypothetical protein AABN95_15855 [Acidobacteriota bacterium]
MVSERIEERLITSSASAAPWRPLRNLFITLSLTVASLTLAGYFWKQTGYEMLIVAMGWPHVILGFVFYFGRVIRGEAEARPSFLILALLTLTIWLVHFNYAITGLIYLYFLYHAFRDEIFVFLQTRTRHRPSTNLYAVAGVGPLILLMLLVPKQEDFRQDLRRVELSSAQFVTGGWTLVPFKPVPNSAGRNFYFYLQAPHTEGQRGYVTHASVSDTIGNGEALVGDEPWNQARDLTFRPHYADEPQERFSRWPAPDDILVLLTGGHRVGQSFKAERNNLDGIWLPIDSFDQPLPSVPFVFHLASPPLLPYSRPLSDLRIVLLVILGAVVLWRLIPRRGERSQLWILLLVLATAFAAIQMTLKTSSNAGHALPLLFQFVVVFHYWSWYVFSYDKLLSSGKQSPSPARNGSLYDYLLGYLRLPPHFTAAVIMMHLISAAGVLWYYRGNGPATLRFFFDYNYFLYILVFHVTFSFKPKLPWKNNAAIGLPAK